MFQVEIVCTYHNRALTPTTKAPKQPFGKQWAIYNIEAECEAGEQACADFWKVVVNGVTQRAQGGN
jgi:hypothetical protein